MGRVGTSRRISDPLMDCKECHERFRADKLIEDYAGENGIVLDKPIDAFSQEEMKQFYRGEGNSLSNLRKAQFYRYQTV